jgi:hypothetical protein
MATKWTVLLEFRHDVPAFEVTVEADKKADAIIIAEEAAVAAGYADAELRSITTWPLINWIKKDVA